MTDEWTTIVHASRLLGCSERQARRYAEQLAPEDRDTQTKPARVRLAAMWLAAFACLKLPLWWSSGKTPRRLPATG